MKRFAGATAIILVAMLAMAGVTGCAGETSPPTSASTTSTTSADAAAGEFLQAAQEYEDQMRAWVETYWLDELGQPVESPEFEDILEPTAREIRRARDYATLAREALDALRTIVPPPEIEAAHADYCSAMSTEVAALDRMITGIEYGNYRDMQLAYDAASEAEVLGAAAMNALDKYVDLPDVLQN